MGGPITGYYFPRVAGFHHKLLYEFSELQLAALETMVRKQAKIHGLPDVTHNKDDFIFLRTVWAAARELSYEFTPHDNEDKERFWTVFRANVLKYAIHCYAHDARIDFRRFPDVGVSGEW